MDKWRVRHLRYLTQSPSSSPTTGAKTLSGEGAAIDFVRDAFAHLKAVAVDQGGQTFLKMASVGHDAGVVSSNDTDAFVAAAKTRQWEREKLVRTVA
jgi:catalase